MAVVSDGALEYVPFAALPAPDDPARALVDGHEIVRLPSASILAVQRERGRDPMARADGLVAIVADPVYSADDRRVSGRPEGEQSTEERLRSFAIPSLRRLEHSGDEAKTIASLVPGERTLVLAGFDANRSRVLESDLGSYLYVHFAAHGMIDTEYPKVSSLVLSQVDESGRAEEDGYLRLHDIYGMELDNVDMVVLSACETALGKEVRGEGLMGLTRGFLYAGSRRVAASLWQVQDDKTEELMEHFYRGLFEENLAPAEALRHAQIAVRDSEEGDYSFPYYWDRSNRCWGRIRPRSSVITTE
jgi:CHAT domain-containing protein